MELSVFERTAQRAEKLAETSFSYYKFKLVLFALLGYFVIFSAIGLTIGSLVGIGYLAYAHTAWILLLFKKKIGFLLIPVIWMLLRACWVRIEAPSGFELKKKDYPVLFAEIDSIRKDLDAPRIHQVILTQEMNAAIAQTPRLGIFGWQKNTLILGMELLLILSPEQIRSVIAHEFGHLSGNHSRFNGWIYRVRTTWFQIMQAFDQQHSWGGAIMAKFFDFYAPRFAAYSFVLARANEYEADNIATGPLGNKFSKTMAILLLGKNHFCVGFNGFYFIKVADNFRVAGFSLHHFFWHHQDFFNIKIKKTLFKVWPFVFNHTPDKT